MDPGAGSVGELGEDLVLLSLRDGRLSNPQQIGFALMGSELVRLAAAGRITIESDRIVVADPAQTGDADLDTALGSLVRAGRPPRPKHWVSHPRRGLSDSYLARLAAAGVVQAERGSVLGIFPATRWRVIDQERLSAARARLDAIAGSDGPVDTPQAAYGGLAHAAGLGMRLYPGWGNRRLRSRLEQIARNKVPSAPAADASTAAATRAAASAAEAARRAAYAAQQAATQAAINAATAAATSAAVSGPH